MNPNLSIDELYSVSYAPGSCGQFIRTMIVYMLRNDTDTIDFSNGNSHDYVSRYLAKRSRLPLHGHIKFNGDRFETIHKHATIEDLPLVVAGGLDLMDHTLYSRFPKFKCILIKADIDDALALVENHYYKNSPFNNHLAKQYYETYTRCADIGIMRPGVSSISELEPSEMRQLFEIQGKEDISMFITEMESRISNWPTELGDKLFTINFKDITANMKEVISTLEKITNMTISDAAIEQYHRYVEKQMQFKKEHGLV